MTQATDETTRHAVLIDGADSVATAIRDLDAGTVVTVAAGGTRYRVALIEDIAYGHKFALRDIARDDGVVKYGAEIGKATQEIRAGAHVHSHNLRGSRFRGDLVDRKETGA